MNSDELIDRALREYVAQEPLAGFDARILRRVQRPNTARRFLWVGGLAVACGAMWMFVRPPHEVERPAPVISARTEEPALLPVAPAPARRKRSGEQALLKFARKHPEQAMALTSEGDGPVAIDALDLAPMTIDELKF